MSLLSRGKKTKRQLERLHKFAKDAPNQINEISKTAFFLKGALLGVAGGVVKAGRGAGALLGGTLLGPILTGLGYQKTDVLKIINSPLESWWKQIKDKWAAVSKEKDPVAGVMKGIFIGIPLGIGSGILALLENGISGVWTALWGGWSLTMQALNLSKKIGELVDNSSIFAGIARTNVFGSMLLAGAKLIQLWDPAYGEKIDEIRKEYPNALEVVRQKFQNLIESEDPAKKEANQYRKTASHISSHLQNRATGLRHQVDTMQDSIRNRQNRQLQNRELQNRQLQNQELENRVSSRISSNLSRNRKALGNRKELEPESPKMHRKPIRDIRYNRALMQYNRKNEPTDKNKNITDKNRSPMINKIRRPKPSRRPSHFSKKD